MEQSDVLIVGAGPTGLVLALWLTKPASGCASSTRPRARHHLARAGGAGAHARALPAARPRRRGRRAGPPGAAPSISGSRASARRASPFGDVGHRTDALSVPAHLPAGRARAAADRAARGARRRGRAAHRAGRLRRATASGVAARLRGPDGSERDCAGALPRRLRRRALGRARDASAPAFPAAPTGRSSTSPTSTAAGPRGRRRAARRSRRGRFPRRLPAGRRRHGAADRHGARRARRPMPETLTVRRRQRPGRSTSCKVTVEQGELVLDLSRASPRGRRISARAAPSCSATPRTSTARPAARA